MRRYSITLQRVGLDLQGASAIARIQPYLGCNPTPFGGVGRVGGRGPGNLQFPPPPTPLLGRLKIDPFLGPKKTILENSRTGMLIELLDPDSNQDSDFIKIIFIKKTKNIFINLKYKKKF